MIVETFRYREGFAWQVIDLEPLRFCGTAIGLNEQTGKTLHFALLLNERGYFWVTWNAILHCWMKPKERPYVQDTFGVLKQVQEEHPTLRFTFFVTFCNEEGQPQRGALKR